MIGTYWTIEYINPNTKKDETHTLKVISINGGVLRVSCYFPSLSQTSTRNTSESTIKREGCAATAKEIAVFNNAFNTTSL